MRSAQRSGSLGVSSSRDLAPAVLAASCLGEDALGVEWAVALVPLLTRYQETAEAGAWLRTRATSRVLLHYETVLTFIGISRLLVDGTTTSRSYRIGYKSPVPIFYA